ncbi:Cap [Eumops bonariensis associated circovirus 1]|uniref:Cap n=1 Tax=Eumops bonariensis associated circovirus 1 TaxID=2911954 RepID=UPI002481D4D2|nr:Cap [Eumops bonariensis associated circovirus 1]UJO02097.1 Cap [Eumops bonariensis associated circovirus 1]
MAYLRRRRYRPTRPRLYRRRRKAYRRHRRRLFIRTRRVGSYYTEKFTHNGAVNISLTSSQLTKNFAVYYTLAEFFTDSPRFDYFTIKWASWSLVPSTPTGAWVGWGKATSVIDYDDNKVTQNPTTLSYTTSPTTRFWKPQRGTRRFFKPRPGLQETEGISNYFFSRNPWINASHKQVKWYGVKYSIQASNGCTMNFIQQKTIWVLWKSVL